MKKKVILILLCAFSYVPVFGITIWSIGGGLWSTTSTTGPDCSCTPSAGDDIIVDDAGASITGLGDLTGTIEILNGGDLTIDGLTMITPSTLTIRSGGTLNVTVDLKPKETAFILVENGGTLNVGNRLEITNDAIMVIEGDVNVDGDKMVLKNNASLIIHSTGVLNMTDPTSTLDINSTGTLIVDGILGTPEEFKLNNSTMGGSGQISHGGTCSAGSGTINGEDDTFFCDAGLGGSIPMGSFYDTFYSLADGDWDDNNSWTFTSDGSSGAVGAGIWPGRYDNVIIRNGHTITIDAVDDNNFPGISPDDLFKSNVGAFTSSNVSMFYHSSDIIVDAGGELSVTTIRSMFEGFLYVNGTFNSTQDIVNLGNLEVTAAATFNTDDDIILSGNSYTTFNNTSTGDDDIYIDHTDALLCGTGIVNIGNGGADPEILYFNGATEAQICSSLTIICSINCGVGPFVPPASPGNFSLGYTGPGGIADVDGSTELVLWLDANTIGQGTGTNLSTWSDQSGYGNDATSPGGSEPIFNTSQINGFPAVQFVTANSDYMQVADDASLNIASVTMFVVGNLENTSTAYAAFAGKLGAGVAAFDGYVILRDNANQGVSFGIDDLANISTSGVSDVIYGTYGIFSGVYDDPGLQLFIEEEAQTADTYAGPITDHGQPLYIGATINAAASGVDRFLEGDISEVIVITRGVNNAERIIVDNFLAAKYGLSLFANNVYEMDDVGNGDYDYEVAGIGQATDGSFNKDAQGTGIVRMSLPTNLDNNEFLMFGHDGTSIDGINTVDVDGTIIEARYSRVWRVSENDDTGTAVDVGAVRLTFDVGSAPPGIVGSDLRLLITRDDASFADNDVTPQTGSYNIDDQLITFSNVLLEDGDRFTLGTTDNTSSPLPIELISFSATKINAKIELEWSTASELNNDFFTIERSDGLGEWNKLGIVPGAGNSTSKLEYDFFDNLPRIGNNYYRLKQTDFDGTSTYSNIQLVILGETDLISVYPNPFDQRLLIYGNLDILTSDISLYNVLGDKVSIKVESQGELTQVKAEQLGPGVYFLKILMNNSIRTIRVIKL